MNSERRKQIAGVITKLNEAREDLSRTLDEEQDAFDNLPESLQGSERGDIMQTAVDTMSDVDGLIDDAISQLEEMVNN